MMTLATPKVTIPRRIGRCIKRNAKKAFTPVKLAVGAGLVAVDQASKFIALKFLPTEDICINVGSAFGVDGPGCVDVATALKDYSGLNEIYAYATLGWIGVNSAVYITTQKQPFIGAGFGLILAARISNLIDRFYAGGVVDFINTPSLWENHPYNIADTIITLGGWSLVVFGLGKLLLGNGIKRIYNRFSSGGAKNVS